MRRVASVASTTLLLVCASVLAMTIVVPHGSRELHAQQQEFNFDDFNNQARGEELSPAQVVFVLVFYGAIFVVAIAVQAFICFLISNALSAVPSQFRLMEPGMVWLMLIPCFNIVWIFFVYVRVAKSYQNYFRSVGRYDVGDCGESVGLWYCICVCLSIIPCVGWIAGIASLVLMIIYLVKLYGLKGQIQAGVAPPKWGAPM